MIHPLPRIPDQFRRPIFLAAAGAIILMCVAMCGLGAEALYAAAVPVWAAYFLVYTRGSRWMPSWRHAAYLTVLTAMAAAYLYALARATPMARIRWSELPAAVFFLAALHIIVWSMDRLLDKGLTYAFEIAARRGLMRPRPAVRTGLRIAALLLVGGPFIAASLATHWVKFDEATDPQAMYGLEYQTVGFDATDGTRLRSWYVPSTNKWSGAAVVLAPGHGMGKSFLLPQAKALHEEGFNVLVLGVRGETDSEGHARAFGVLESRDVLGAVRYLRQVHPRDSRQIFALGVSHGASAVLAAARADSRIRAVVVDSAFPGPAEELKAMIPLPPAPLDGWFRNATLAIASGLLERDLFRAGALVDIAGVAPRPVLVIHGRDDRTVPPEDARKLVSCAAGPAMLWMADGAGHAEAFMLRRAEYAAMVARTLKSVQAGEPTFGRIAVTADL